MEVSQVKINLHCILIFMLFQVERVQEIQQEVVQQQPIHTLIPEILKIPNKSTTMANHDNKQNLL